MAIDNKEKKVLKKAKFVFKFCENGFIQDDWNTKDGTTPIEFTYKLETDFDKLKKVLYFENDTEGAIITPNLLITNIKLFAIGENYKHLKQAEEYDYHRLFIFISHQLYKIFIKFKVEIRFPSEHKRPIEVFEK